MKYNKSEHLLRVVNVAFAIPDEEKIKGESHEKTRPFDQLCHTSDPVYAAGMSVYVAPDSAPGFVGGSQ